MYFGKLQYQGNHNYNYFDQLQYQEDRGIMHLCHLQYQDHYVFRPIIISGRLCILANYNIRGSLCILANYIIRALGLLAMYLPIFFLQYQGHNVFWPIRIAMDKSVCLE